MNLPKEMRRPLQSLPDAAGTWGLIAEGIERFFLVDSYHGRL